MRESVAPYEQMNLACVHTVVCFQEAVRFPFLQKPRVERGGHREEISFRIFCVSARHALSVFAGNDSSFIIYHGHLLR